MIKDAKVYPIPEDFNLDQRFITKGIKKTSWGFDLVVIGVLDKKVDGQSIYRCLSVIQDEKTHQLGMMFQDIKYKLLEDIEREGRDNGSLSND